MRRRRPGRTPRPGAGGPAAGWPRRGRRRRPPGRRPGGGGRTAAAAGLARGAPACGRGRRRAASRAASSTSCLRIRPPTPVPVTAARSMPCSAASLRTSGVTYGLSAPFAQPPRRPARPAAGAASVRPGALAVRAGGASPELGRPPGGGTLAGGAAGSWAPRRPAGTGSSPAAGSPAGPAAAVAGWYAGCDWYPAGLGLVLVRPGGRRRVARLLLVAGLGRVAGSAGWPATPGWAGTRAGRPAAPPAGRPPAGRPAAGRPAACSGWAGLAGGLPCCAACSCGGACAAAGPAPAAAPRPAASAPPAEPSSSMTASSAPTATVSSSATVMPRRMPDTGEGISVSTLSVETSSSGSSASTCSPSRFSQRVTVPSVTLSPSCGMDTETDIAFRDSFVRRSYAGRPGAAYGHAWKCSGLPASARCASPIASDWVGCGWMSWATSAGTASQL